ncbi:MAG: hypothetical protein H6765_00110 [Candidatus Peribacteria bacterium]|nr:MAG: hypothetical protein H6765_00110 [Candidatus Peribacteria bacterium]
MSTYKIDENYDIIYSTATLHYLGSAYNISEVISQMQSHTND